MANFETMIAPDLDFADSETIERPASPAGWSLRDYQHDCIAAIDAGFEEFTRILAVLGTGGGKTVIFSHVARDEVARGGRVLILAHTEELLDQAADKLAHSTGLESEKEKAEHRASLDASVVIGSIQTLARDARLTAWPVGHFTLIIVDEAHRTLAPSYLKILRYFHYGESSLADDWKTPADGATVFCKILGVTATADRGDKRSLGEFYQGKNDETGTPRPVFDHGLLQLCRDGYLVRPVSVQVPLKIDIRNVKLSRSSAGSDFDSTELQRRITPFLRQIAAEIVAHAHDRKIVCFLPGVETARMLSEALGEAGMNSKFVSGACDDRKEKLEWFERAGPGSGMCNAMLLTEGWDCDDVSAVCVLRPTKIRSLYAQCVGRGSRTLKGLINGLKTREERLRAIEASAKKDLLIVDFLWHSDNLNLIESVDLIATAPAARAAMQAAAEAGKGGDIINFAEAADRDLLKSLEKAAKENAKKPARRIDPLAWAVSVGYDALKDYVPQTQWDARPVNAGQKELLRRAGIEPSKVSCQGLADKMIDRILHREKLKLCSVEQLTFLEGYRVKDAAIMSAKEAEHAIHSLRSQ